MYSSALLHTLSFVAVEFVHSPCAQRFGFVATPNVEYCAMPARIRLLIKTARDAAAQDRQAGEKVELALLSDTAAETEGLGKG